ncbi:MAG: hypothetical protein HOV94_44285 [Saccharothrix sp.]|nr:hypothetical protein [Saccharothrix sp.]
MARPAVKRRVPTAPLIAERPLVSAITPQPPPASPTSPTLPTSPTSPASPIQAVPVRWTADTTPTLPVQRTTGPTPRSTPEVDRPVAAVRTPVVAATPGPVASAPATRTVQRTPDRSTTTVKPAKTKPEPPERADLDDLARRLLDPVSRLLRAELRHGRERAGVPHDRRR